MPRSPGTKCNGGSFDDTTIDAVWQKGTTDPLYLFFRKDICRAYIHRSNYGETEQWGWEIDHIKPVSLGGTDHISNLQPLQWENNRHKGDIWPDWGCKINY